VTIADSGHHGGFGSALADALRAGEVDVVQRDVDLPQEFLAHGSRAEILATLGITAQDVADRVAGWAGARPRLAASSGRDRLGSTT
jgi:1-deoxy-D-xylulose-5-phosphate synthase